MFRVYVSSTFADLQEFRLSVQQFLRKAGVVDVAMEYYVSEDRRPLDKCLADVRSCDLYIGVFAWRYGFIPPGHTQSITELEYREAGIHNITRLIFLLHEEALWKRSFQDAVTGEGERGQKITAFREELQQSALVSFFRAKEDLVNELAAALQLWMSNRSNDRPAGQSVSKPPADPGPLRRYLDSIVSPREQVEKYFVQVAGTTKQHRATPPTEWPHELLPSSFRVIAQRTSQAPPKELPLNSIEEALRLHPRFLLLGEPGSGKTTTLKQLRLAAARAALTDASARIPLLIHLADWPDGIAEVRSLIVHESQVQGLPPVPLGQMLLLLDGLNEINPGSWTAKVEAINQWSLLHPDMPLVLSSRYGHDFQGRLETFPAVEMHELDDERVKSFVAKYLGADEAPRLLEQLGWQGKSREQQRIWPLTRNPFQLSLLCYVFLMNDRRLPPNRGLLFRDFARALYQREADRRNHVGISYETMLDAFGRLAVGMLESRASTSVHLAWAHKRVPAEVEADALWRLGVQSSLLRLTKGERFLQFSHQLVQEYFAAEYLARNPERLAACLQPPVFAQGQRLARPVDEIVLLLIGLGDAETVLGSVSAIDPFLAADALTTGAGATLADPGAGLIQEISNGLAEALSTGDEGKEQAASARLVRFGASAVPSVGEVLRTRNPRAGRAALAVLRQIRCVEAIDYIASALQSKHKWVRRDADDALISLSGEDRSLLTAYITKVLPSKDATQRTQMALSLIDLFSDEISLVALISQQSRESVPDTWWEASPNRGQAIWIARADPARDAPALYLKSKFPLKEPEKNEFEELRLGADTNQLMTRLARAGAGLARKIIFLLAEQGESIVPLLLQRLPESVEPLRRRIPRILGLIGDVRAVPVLLPLCQDRSFRVRLNVVRALAMLKDLQALDAVRICLMDVQADVRVQAVRALCRLEDRAMRGAIRYLLINDVNGDVRTHALRALVLLGASTVELDARNALSDEDPAVRSVAVQALVGGGNPIHLPFIERLLHDRSRHVRAAVLKALATRRYRLSVVQVRVALDDPQVCVQLAVVNAMGQTGDRAHIGVLFPLLTAERPSLRAAAASALGLIGDPSAAERIDALLADEHPRVRTAALQALNRLRGIAVFERVVPFLYDSHRMVQKTALVVLESFGCFILPTDGSVEPEARCGTLGQLEPSSSLPALLGYLFDPDASVRLKAAQLVQGQANPRSMAVLKLIADRDPDANVRSALVQAVARVVCDSRPSAASAACTD